MGSLIDKVRHRTIWQAPLMAFVLTALLFVGLTAAHAASEEAEYKVIGTVSSTPGTVDGVGLWGIVDDKGYSHTVRADTDTDFDNGIPQIGDRVEVEAETGGPQPLATEIKNLSDGDDGDDNGKDEVEGTVVQRPAASNGIGIWLIQTQLFLTQTVIADANTKFDDGVPEVGTWVEAEGPRQPDGSIRATRIRPDDYEDGELVVWLESGVLSSTIESRYGVEAKSSLLASANIYLYSTEDDDEPGLINKIRADKDVVWSELNYVHGVPEENGYATWSWGGVDPTGYINQQAFSQVNLPGAQGLYDGSGVVVAVLDTGVALTHTALITRLLPGLDLIADDTLPQDEPAGAAWGHGTHVAGIIARIAPGAQILPIRILDSNGRGNTFLLAYAIYWATRQNVDIISLSLGAEADSSLVRETIRDAFNQGIIVVAAAGNNNLDAISYPAGYDDVIAVTAVDGNAAKAGFANYGTWVDIASPGVGITSTVIGPFGQGYASWTGTSMATPFVAGAAALVRQRNPSSSGAVIVDRLTSTATSLDGVNPDYSGKLGGLLNIGAAVLNQNFDPKESVYLPSMQH